MNIEEMKQVLEVLTDQGRLDPNEYKEKKNESITSLRKAIAEAEKQEPFGWVKQTEIQSSLSHCGSINLWRGKYDCDVTLYTTLPAAPVQETSIPEGWERRTVVGFDALVEALDYAERKGFMPDYITSAWEGFNYMVDERNQS